MKYLAVRNFDRFQHYRNRRPLWVKLYLSLLRDPDFASLTISARLVFVLLLLVAADRDNNVPNDATWLSIEMQIPRATVAKALDELLAKSYLLPASELASTEASATASESAPPLARPRPRVETETDTEVANATSGKRAPDELWDALAAELGEVTTKTERGQRNGALRELREVGATAEDVHARCRAYRRKWPEMALTAAALKKHWSSLEPAKPHSPAPVEEILDLPDITEEERLANVARLRELAGSIGQEVA